MSSRDLWTSSRNPLLSYVDPDPASTSLLSSRLEPSQPQRADPLSFLLCFVLHLQSKLLAALPPTPFVAQNVGNEDQDEVEIDISADIDM